MSMLATVLWTELVNALRADSLIDPAITRSGPQTTAVLNGIVDGIGAVGDKWMSMRIKPKLFGTNVLAVQTDPLRYDVLLVDESGEWRFAAMGDYPLVTVENYRAWTYIKQPKDLPL